MTVQEFTFTPRLHPLNSFTPTASIEELANETGMYSASPDFVREHGGPLTQEILNAIPEDWFQQARDLNLYPNIDVRVHRLYPQDYPAVPGWHCDGEFRRNYHAQPELDKIPEHSHIVGTISTHPNGVSLTEFVSEELTLTYDTEDSANTWEQIHTQVEERQPETHLATDGTLYDFSSYTLHRCTPAQERGWRLFLRASMWHKPYMQGEGTLARQEYVYRLSEETGW